MTDYTFEKSLYFFLRQGFEKVSQSLEISCLDTKEKEFLLKSIAIASIKSFDIFLEYLKSTSDKVAPLFDFSFLRSDEQEKLDATQFKKYLTGKKVALVGPSNSLLGTGNGELIDSYDIVVRLNFSWPIPKQLEKDAGKKMDILYHCCNADFPISTILNEPDFIKTQFVCYQQGVQSLKLRRFCNDHSIRSMCISKKYGEVERITNTSPNTGTVAIHHLLQFSVKELFITGITFFKTPYYSGYRGKGADPIYWQSEKAPKKIWLHSFPSQITYCKKIIAENPNVLIDKTLKEIFAKHTLLPDEQTLKNILTF